MRLVKLGAGLNHIVNMDLINPTSIIIDAGANVGAFIEKMRTLTDSKIYAIECSSRNCATIKNKNFENIEIIEKALVGNNDGPVTFTEYSGILKPNYAAPAGQISRHRYHQWSNILGNHRDKFANNSSVKTEQYEVVPVTLSELIEQYDLKSIDYLKMDIEGAEYDVFEHMTRKETDIIKQISLEVHDKNKNKSLFAKIRELGFVVRELEDNEVYAYRK